MSELALDSRNELENLDKQTAECMSPEEIDRLTSLIYLDDPGSILRFGDSAAKGAAETADSALSASRLSASRGAKRLMEQMGEVMGRFDMNELTRPSRSLFRNQDRMIDKLCDKYAALEAELDRVFAELAAVEEELNDSNRLLEELYAQALERYGELVRYIVAGEAAEKEIEGYISQFEEKLKATGDRTLEFEIISLKQALDSLKRRVFDLKTAKTVAMQSIPMLKLMQRNNMALQGKLNSAFTLTLPVFKQALAETIVLKRQRAEAQALAALDKRAAEMLRSNAPGLSLAGVRSDGGGELARLYGDITRSIRETREMNADNTVQLDMAREDLARIKREFEDSKR